MVGSSEHRRRIIWFCGTEAVAEDPGSLARLRDAVGLTTIMPESPVCHTSGFRASEAMAARGPFEDWRERVDRFPRAAQGIYPPVAGIVGGFDDAPLRAVIDAAGDAGIEVWGHIGLWSYGGEVYPEYAMRDVDGAELTMRWHKWGIGLCPSHPAVDGWTADGLAEVTREYGIDGFCVDHARFPQPANLHALTACGCEHCLAAGRELGFDADGLAEAVRDAREALRRIDAARVRRALESDLRGADLWVTIGVPRQAWEWLRMRAAILAQRMDRFRRRVGEVRDGLVFGSDVFAPTIAFYGGHDLPRWEAATDFVTGGSSHGGVVGWATGATTAAGEWVRALRLVASEVAETEAAELALRLLCQDDVDLPREAAGLLAEASAGSLPVAELYDREVARLVAATTGRVPLYPPISVGGDAERARRLGEVVRERRCHGAMITIDPADATAAAALREGLGPLAGA
jgi:hypothetical protein